LGKACQVRFVEKGALAGYAMEPRVTLDTEPGTISVATPIAAPVAAPVEGSIEGGIEVDENDAQAVVSDPYLEAVSDPVIQDLVSRGGQVTGVQMLAEDE
jgi:hypothetical protein